MGSRKIILIAAVLAGLLAAVGIVAVVRNVQSEAEASAATKQVWVAKDTIQYGTSVQEAVEGGLLHAADRVANDLPSGSIEASTEILDVLPSDHLAATEITRGQVIQMNSFGSPRVAGNGLASRLTGKHRADLVTLTLDFSPEEAAGGLLVPGDRVNILSYSAFEGVYNESGELSKVPFISADSFEELKEDSARQAFTRYAEVDAVAAIIGDAESYDDLSAEAQNQIKVWVAANVPVVKTQQLSRSTAIYLAQNVEVLAVGEKLVSQIGQSAGAELVEGANDSTQVTFAVTPEQVQIILNASQELDGLYLSVVPEGYQPRDLFRQDQGRVSSPGETASSSPANQ